MHKSSISLIWRRRATFLSLAAAAFLSGCAASAQQLALPPSAEGATSRSAAAVAPALVFERVTTIDVNDGRRLPEQTVVVVGNRVQAIGPAGKVQVPRGATIVAAQGKYLIPGLWDMHAHMKHPGPVGLPDSSSKFQQPFYSNFIAHGVTGIRWLMQRFPFPDIADSFRVWQHEIAVGTRIGPRAVGPTVDLAFNGRDDGSEGFTIATPEDARRILDSLKAAGVALVKLHDNRMAPDLYFAIMREARRVGLPAAGHVAAGMTEVQVADSGLRSVEHVNEHPTCWRAVVKSKQADSLRMSELCAPAAEAYIRNGTWLVPTAVTLKYYKANMHDVRSFVRTMHRLGVTRFLTGTDTGPTHWRRLRIRPGLSVLEELVLLVESGLTPLEALQAATLNPAKFYEATDSLGTVAPGKLADLVLLDADPLADIHNVMQIQAVVANGRYFDRAALEALRVDEVQP